MSSFQKCMHKPNVYAGFLNAMRCEIENPENPFATLLARAQEARSNREDEEMLTINLTLRADDAEPILRAAAMDAARYGSWCDYITAKTYNPPFAGNGQTCAEQKAGWNARFLKAKRMVEAFGVEYEMVSEQETLTVHIPMKNEKRTPRNIAGMKFIEVTGGEPDYRKPMPEYRRGVHDDACRAAADRVVRAWRELIRANRAA